MAASEPAALSVQDPQWLGLDDAAGGLALSIAAGWNQTLDDWRIFIGHGRTFGCRDGEGRLVATAAALPYDGGFGWISMVLVNPQYQHRGLATRLMADCVQALQQAGITPVLDATPAGAEVYRRIGFVPGFELHRWQGQGGGGAAAPQSDAATSSAIRALDRSATGLGRAVVIDDFLSRPTTQVWLSDDGTGFVLLRRGHRAWQLGPLVASDEASAISLLRQALAAADGRVFLDVPRQWSTLTAWLATQGFEQQRGFVRMSLGSAPPVVPECVFVLAGPEFG